MGWADEGRHHDLAYRFFAAARWSADQLGLVLLDLICTTLLPTGAPVVLATDDTLWHRAGRKLHGAAWHHDGNGPGRHRPAWGHRWVVVGVICHPPFLDRAVCLPILARPWIPGDPDHTHQLARGLLDLVCGHLGDRPVHLAAHRARAPRYRTKRTVSIADMLAALRCALLAAQYQHGHLHQHTLDLFPDALLTQLNPAA